MKESKKDIEDFKRYSLESIHEKAISLEFHAPFRNILGENFHFLNEVKELHRKNYSKLFKYKKGRCLVRRASIKFGNLYCFGEDNEIDFSIIEDNLSGTIAPTDPANPLL